MSVNLNAGGNHTPPRPQQPGWRAETEQTSKGEGAKGGGVWRRHTDERHDGARVPTGRGLTDARLGRLRTVRSICVELNKRANDPSGAEGRTVGVSEGREQWQGD